ncbi:MAG: hypothetical protein Q8O55_03865 [Dehalococcoidales bacterium]|nr:hypothetical protein [Dehalococcoidales bacterium]
MEDNQRETRQERREKKLEKKKERMQKHGGGLARIYKEAILKQINKLRNDKEKGKDSREV